MIKLLHNTHDHDAIDLVTVFTSRNGNKVANVWSTVHIDFFSNGADSVHEALLASDVDCVMITQAEYDALTTPPAAVAERTE